MNNAKFSDGTRDRRQPISVQSDPKHLTIAQSIRRSMDPYRAAIASFSRRDVIRRDDDACEKKIFYFEDGSFLTFEVSYTAVEDGGRE